MQHASEPQASDVPPMSSARVEFDTDQGIAELRLDHLRFDTPVEVNRWFDAAEAIFADSDRPRWRVITNVTGFDPEGDPKVWLTYARRMHVFSRALCMSRCLLDTHSRRRRMAIPGSGGNGAARRLPLYSDRGAARRALLAQPAEEDAEHLTAAQLADEARDIRARLRLQMNNSILVIDLRGAAIRTARQCHAFYDVIDDTLRVTGRKWFFLIRYEGLCVAPEVWPCYAARGKALNLEFSLGTVRISPSDAMADEIADRAASQNFDPNLFATEAEGRARIEELRAALPSQGVVPLDAGHQLSQRLRRR